MIAYSHVRLSLMADGGGRQRRIYSQFNFIAYLTSVDVLFENFRMMMTVLGVRLTKKIVKKNNFIQKRKKLQSALTIP